MRLTPGTTVTAAQRVRAREVYEDGFPEEWLRAEFDDLFADEVLVALTEDDEVAGLVVVRALADTGWTFVRYFVAGLRGQGVGSELWAALAAARAARGDTRIVLDVESPDEAGIDAAEREVRERRVRFYERNGLQLLPVSDYAPPHGDDPADTEAHPMRLMLADLTPPAPNATPGPRSCRDTPGDRGVSTRSGAEDLRAVVTAVFEHRYGIRPGHPAVDAALATVESQQRS